jgi:hypothetical protein
MNMHIRQDNDLFQKYGDSVITLKTKYKIKMAANTILEFLRTGNVQLDDENK